MSSITILDELKNRLVPRPWKDRVRQSIDLIEMERDSRMGEANLIGRISRRQPFDAKSIIRLKSVHFSWQRGVKIGNKTRQQVYSVLFVLNCIMSFKLKLLLC